jgi:lipopolysaccharide transport system ATP-binding protein
VRLAFAVAAHLDSEILIVDEVLAVGDAEFQKKCIGKMGDISKGEGRTILFVSHVLSMVKSLCQNSILMQDGGIKQIGVTSEVLENYNNIRSANSLDGVIPDDYPRLYTLGNTRFEFIALYNEEGSKAATFYFREQIQVEITFRVINEILNAVLFLIIKSRDGIDIVYKETFKNRYDVVNLTPCIYSISGDLNVNLMPGNYNITLVCSRNHDGLTYEMVENVYEFAIVKESKPSSNLDYKWNKNFGYVLDNDVLKVKKLEK